MAKSVKTIELVERNGVFIPIKSRVTGVGKVTQKSQINLSSLGKPGNNLYRKELARPQIDIEKIAADIVGDFFKVVRKEMFR
jgi:hypothetical protein